VVAERGGIEAQRVHRRDHRVNVTLGHAPLVGHVVAHRVALQEVAVVEENRVGRFRANPLDQRSGARQAHRVHGPVAVIVVGKDVNMNVGRFHDAQMRLTGLRTHRKRMHRDEPRRGGEKGTAVQ
jgi:hypothetical protein